MAIKTQELLFLLIVLLSNIIQCITGFAGTVLAMPFSVILIGDESAKAILNVLGAAASIGVVIPGFRKINKKGFLKIVGFMLPGIIAGHFLSQMLASAVRVAHILLGSIVILFAILNFVKLFSKKEAKKPGPVLSAGILLGSGLIHGVFVCGGPLLVTYASRRFDDTEEFRSTLSAVWIVLNGIMIFSHWQSGFFDRQTLFLLAISLVILVAAVLIGNLIAKKLSKKVFLILSYVLMIISGLSLLIQ